MICDFTKKKVYNYLEERPYTGKALFIFNHGLGDLINFLPLFERLKKLFPYWRFKIGCAADRRLDCLSSSIITLDYDFRTYLSQYTYIFKISYPEPCIQDKRDKKYKPYICNEMEIGIPNFEWKPFKLNINLNNENSNIIGVHFTGNTNPKLKNINFLKMEMIWREIKNSGYDPFEVHMNTTNTYDLDYPSFINSNNSLRFKKSDLRLILDTVKKCKYFIGIDSGPFYLAGSVLGLDRCIGLENKIKFSWYLPYNISLINSDNYENGMVEKLLKNLDKKYKLC